MQRGKLLDSVMKSSSTSSLFSPPLSLQANSGLISSPRINLAVTPDGKTRNNTESTELLYFSPNSKVTETTFLKKLHRQHAAYKSELIPS